MTYIHPPPLGRPTMNASASTASDLQKLATGSALAFGGAVLGNGLTYLFGLVMGRTLGPEVVGLYFLALILMQLAGTLSRLGFGDGLLRFVAIHAGEASTARVKGSILFTLALATTVSVLIAAALLTLAGPISTHLFRQPTLAPYLAWMAVTLPFFTVLILSLNATQALKRMDLVVLSRDCIQPVTMIVAGILLYPVVMGPAGFLASHLLSMVFASALSLYFLVRAWPDLRASESAEFDNWKLWLAFALPVAGSDVIHFLFRWSDTLLLSFLRSASEVGVYNAAVRTTLLLNLLAVAITALYAPIIADHHHHGRHGRIEIILKTLIRWCLTIALPIVLAMCLLAEPILLLWGSNFGSGSTVLMIMAASQLLFIISSLLAFTLLMCGRQYLELGNVAFVTALNVGVNVILIPRFGMTGAAIAMLSSQAVILLVRLAEVRHVLGLRLYTATYLKPAIALIPASLLGIALQPLLPHFASTFVGPTVAAMFTTAVVISAGYLGSLFVFGFEDEDVSVWRQFRTTSRRPRKCLGTSG
jgi:O-antigen/teichoic acid export membrane protein